MKFAVPNDLDEHIVAIAELIDETPDSVLTALALSFSEEQLDLERVDDEAASGD
jgi:hypothetical protein